MHEEGNGIYEEGSEVYEEGNEVSVTGNKLDELDPCIIKAILLSLELTYNLFLEPSPAGVGV